jgi:Domain of unknown function (DUF4388)
MGSPELNERHPAHAASEGTLAQLVQRCRGLDQYLAIVRNRLPCESEAPFLYAQLHEELRRLDDAFVRLGMPTAVVERGRNAFRWLLGTADKRHRRSAAPVRCEFQGCARAISVSEVISFLSHSGKTGLLRVTARQETFELEFSFGELAHASSNASPPGLLLGELLVREDLVEPAEVFSAIESARNGGELLGSFLVRSGRLAILDLQRVLTIQVQEIFRRMLAEENALFGFQELPRTRRAHGLDMNITRLLLDNAQRQDEQRLLSTRAEAANVALTVEEPPPALPAPRSATPQDRAKASVTRRVA